MAILAIFYHLDLDHPREEKPIYQLATLRIHQFLLELAEGPPPSA
jgi:hypothetical protein